MSRSSLVDAHRNGEQMLQDEQRHHPGASPILRMIMPTPVSTRSLITPICWAYGRRPLVRPSPCGSRSSSRTAPPHHAGTPRGTCVIGTHVHKQAGGIAVVGCAGKHQNRACPSRPGRWAARSWALPSWAYSVRLVDDQHVEQMGMMGFDVISQRPPGAAGARP